MTMTSNERESGEISRRRYVPPYAAFQAFDNFLRRAAAEALPVQVDKALLIGWGIATGNESGLLTTLKALGIIDDTGRPTELFRELRLSQPRRVAALRRAIDRAYPGLASGGEAIDNNRLYDYFVEERGLTGQMVDKATRFYRQLLDALERDLAPSEAGAARRRATRVASASTRPTNEGLVQPRTSPSGPARSVLPLPFSVSSPESQPDILHLNLLVQIPANLSEDELTDLFGRLRRAWWRSQLAKDA